jgi:hypothetical protein
MSNVANEGGTLGQNMQYSDMIRLSHSLAASQRRDGAFIQFVQ